jgi:hypothetical protein
MSGDQSRYVAVRRCAPPFCQEGALTLAIHRQARTPPAVRAEIARFHESSGVLAERHGVTTELDFGQSCGVAEGIGPGRWQAEAGFCSGASAR